MRRRIPEFSHILSWSVFLFWSGMFAIYYFSGDYVDILNPQFGWLVLMAFILSLVFFLALFFRPENSPGHHHHHHLQHGSIDLVRLLILLAPILYIAGYESGNLGSYAFKKRALNITGIDENAGNMGRNMNIVSEPGYDKYLVASAAAKLPERVSIIDIHADFEKLLGKNIQTVGRYMSQAPGVPDDKFVIFRFVMVCCVADAQPVAVLVKGPRNPNLKEESWLEVEGILEKATVQGNPAAVINATRIRTTGEPANPYLTPMLR